jgi:peptide chain release factor 1
VHDLSAAYLKYGQSLGYQAEMLSSTAGHDIVKFTGKGVWKAFKNESGKHVVQRIPPTEKNGKRQTSVISVAVLPLPPVAKKDEIPERDLEITTTKGTGPGGQNKNKVESAVRIVHKPTKLAVFIDGRDQGQNKREALAIITARVRQHYEEKQTAAYNSQRKQQMGDGGRGDKVRTYNFIKSRVVDHRLGVKTRNVEAIMKGKFSILFDGEKCESSDED